MGPVELAAKLTLLALLFSHVGDWSVRPLVLILAGFGLPAIYYYVPWAGLLLYPLRYYLREYLWPNMFPQYI